MDSAQDFQLASDNATSVTSKARPKRVRAKRRRVCKRGSAVSDLGVELSLAAPLPQSNEAAVSKPRKNKNPRRIIASEACANRSPSELKRFE